MLFFVFMINWFIANLINSLTKQISKILQCHIVSLETDLFAGARLFPCYFLSLLYSCYSFFVRRQLFSASTWYSLKYGQNISISKQSARVLKSAKMHVVVCMHVCVCAIVLRFVCVSGCWTPWQGQLSEIFYSNIRWHLCLPLTQKQNCYLLYTLQRHTNDNDSTPPPPREMVSEVKKGWREKQKQKVLSQCLSIIKHTFCLQGKVCL